MLNALFVGLWCYVFDIFGWRLWLSLGVLGLAVAAAAWGWWRSPCGFLSWDGQLWCWTSTAPRQARNGQLLPCLDFQRHLLLRLRLEAGPVLWLWAEQHSNPARWADLRRAVYARSVPSSALLALAEPRLSPAPHA